MIRHNGLEKVPEQNWQQ